jgi:hypothetical protein
MTMTREISLSLLNRATTGSQLLTILDAIVDDVTEQNINDCAAHWAAIHSEPVSARTEFANF